jgi:hypothetical protein
MIDAAVASARDDLAAYNHHVKAGDPVHRQAVGAGLRVCEFLLDCTAVWRPDPPDLGELEVLQGAILSIQARAGKSALRIAIPGQQNSVIVSGLSNARFREVGSLAVDDIVRIGGLRRTARGMFKAGQGRLSISNGQSWETMHISDSVESEDPCSRTDLR